MSRPAMPLPVEAYLPKLVEMFQAHPCGVVVAEPGAGKTTEIPNRLLQMWPDGAIWVLQPRRLAARLAARRVAARRQETLGSLVGYRVRFEEVCGPHARLVFMTEGLLLRSLLANPTLQGVTAVVFDEFHERSLAADVSLGILRHLQAHGRPDLRLLVMSATLDTPRLANFLGQCPILSIPGRQFPVHIQHAPQHDTRPLETQVRAAVGQILRQGLDGDILVFLPGTADIRRSASACAPLAAQYRLQVLPLHGSLSPAEQDLVVAPGPQPKLILATNVAETSVTLANVAVVVDSGLAHTARHSSWSGLRTLETRPVSQASLAQRAGRAGRVRPGRCLRLFTVAQGRARPTHDVPEMLRSDLAETALLLAAMQAPSLQTLPLLDPPPAAATQAANELLMRLGAFDGHQQLTALGQQMARLPLHPRLGRLLLAAHERGATGLGCSAAATLSEWRPRTAFEPIVSGPSDLTVAMARHNQRSHLLQQQLRRALGKRSASRPAADEEVALAQAVLAAFPDRVARRTDGMQLLMCNGSRLTLAADSVVRDPEFLVAIEAQELQRGARRHLVVHVASAIEPDWLLDQPLLRDDDQTVWNDAQERVERLLRTCYGSLVLSETRTAQVHPESAAEVLADAVKSRGLADFLDLEQFARLRVRLQLVQSLLPALAVPSFDNETLQQTVARACHHCTSFAQLRQAGLWSALLNSLSAEVTQALHHLTPLEFTLPNGRKLPVHYEMHKPPWVESWLQDFFGMAEGPRIGGGRIALTLHLLAPNRRAVQVTGDLQGFWERHYPGLKNALSRRYPRHAWPDDPLHSAAPAPRPGKR